MLEQLLYHLGRWIYLVDAADDLKKDVKNGSYNPLVPRFGAQAGELCLLYTSMSIVVFSHERSI